MGVKVTMKDESLRTKKVRQFEEIMSDRLTAIHNHPYFQEQLSHAFVTGIPMNITKVTEETINLLNKEI